MDTKIESARKADPGEENSAALAEAQNLQPFDHETGALTTEPSPLPNYEPLTPPSLLSTPLFLPHPPPQPNLFDGSDAVPRAVLINDGVGAGAAEDDQIQQGVGAQAIGPMDRGTGCFTRCVQAWDDLITFLFGVLDHLQVGRKKTISGHFTHIADQLTGLDRRLHYRQTMGFQGPVSHGGCIRGENCVHAFGTHISVKVTSSLLPMGQRRLTRLEKKD